MIFFFISFTIAQCLMRVAFVSFDHLVRSRQYVRWDRQPMFLAVLRLITSSNFVGCSTGRSPGLAPLEDLIHIGSGAPEHFDNARAVKHEATSVHKFCPLVYRREAVLCREVCNLCPLRREARGPPSTRTALSMSLACGSRNTVSISLELLTSRYCSLTPSVLAASSVSFNTCALPGRVDVPRTATWESLRTISLRNSNCFPLMSGYRV